jgi:hypothetical protein
MERRTVWLVLLLAAMTAAGAARAETPPAIASGYEDLDRDGANDHFRDANGDGVNDVTRAAYAHRFRFADADGDGINDLFVDADGDGVNDRNANLVDADGDGICDNVLDADGDGVNDVTGLPYREELHGWRFGRIAEENGERVTEFIDADGDGMHDHWAMGRGPGRAMDLFIDEDGDGIADGRSVWGRLGELRCNGELPLRRGMGPVKSAVTGPDDADGQRRRGAGHRGR